jgi:hypothetical protein
MRRAAVRKMKLTMSPSDNVPGIDPSSGQFHAMIRSAVRSGTARGGRICLKRASHILPTDDDCVLPARGQVLAGGRMMNTTLARVLAVSHRCCLGAWRELSSSHNRGLDWGDFGSKVERSKVQRPRVWESSAQESRLEIKQSLLVRKI